MSDLVGRTVAFTIKGKSIKLSETTLADFAAFRDHIKTARLKQIFEATKDISIGERTIFINEVVREPVTDLDVQMELQNLEGMLFMLYRSMLKNQSDITLEEVFNMFTSFSDEDLAAITTVQSSLGAPDKEDEKNSKRAMVKK